MSHVRPSRRTAVGGRWLRTLPAVAAAVLTVTALVALPVAAAPQSPTVRSTSDVPGQSLASDQSTPGGTPPGLAAPRSPSRAVRSTPDAPGLPLATTRITLVDVKLSRGDEFSDTTDPYWEEGLKVYRRGDTFEVTLQTDDRPDGFGFTVKGPSDYGWVFDRIECRRTDDGVECDDGHRSARGHIEFVGFDAGSPEFNVTLKRPETTDVRVGRYGIFNAYATECTDDRCWTSTNRERPFYVVFNPFEGSGDDHVTGLGRAALADRDYGYVLGTTSKQFHWKENESYQVEPTNETVFEYAIDEVDSLGADATSAKQAATKLTKTVNGDVTGDWSEPYGDRGTSFMSGTDVPETIDTIESPGEVVCGQCMTFAALTVGTSRSVGIPSRMVTGWDVGTGDGDKSNARDPDRTNWTFHMWAEGWLNEVSGGDWAAYDATPPTSSGQPPATLPTDESHKPALVPDSWASKTLIPPVDESKILASKWDGTAEDVTNSYRDPPGPPGSDVVSVAPREPAVGFGEDIGLEVTVDNPGTTSLNTTVTVTLAPEYVDTIYRRQVTTIATRNVTVTVPPNGTTTRTVTVPQSTYLVNGRFAVRAATTVDGAPEVATTTVDVDRRLSLRVSEPADPTVGEETTVTMTVRNLRDEPVDDVDVRLHPPTDADASPTHFTVGSLGALESATLNVTLAPDALPLTVEAQATSPDAGLAYRSAVLGGDDAAGSDLSVGEPSATVGSGESVETTVTFEGVPGESVSVSASVPEGVSVSFDPANGTVGPNGQFATTATLAADAGLERGEYVVVVTARGGASIAYVATIELTVAAAPAFEVDYDVRETTVATDETATVVATVENAGTAAGEATLALRVDGVERETRTVVVDSGETRTVEFAASFDAPGEHSVRVNDLDPTTVEVEATPGTSTPSTTTTDGGGSGIGGFGVATGLVALLVAALAARRSVVGR